MTETCPTCGHCHPGGVGAAWCICDDCALMWTTTPIEVLAPEYRDRHGGLWAAARKHRKVQP